MAVSLRADKMFSVMDYTSHQIPPIKIKNEWKQITVLQNHETLLASVIIFKCIPYSGKQLNILRE